MPAQAPSPRPAIGDLLRYWRGVRGKSQLDLALDSGVSQRHVSFLETGRSAPSRQMVIDLSDALGVPLRDRNAIMLAAGYAPFYTEDAPESLPPAVERAVRRMLRQHQPFPAVVMDRYWNVIATNDAAPAFFGKLIDLEAWARPRNLLRLIFDPKGLRPFLVNFDEVSHSMLWRIKREAVGGVVDERLKRLLGELTTYPMGQDRIEAEASGTRNDELSVIPLRFRAEKTTLSMFSMVTTVGTPQSIVAEEIRLESMFPSDDDAERDYLDFMDMALQDPKSST